MEKNKKETKAEKNAKKCLTTAPIFEIIPIETMAKGAKNVFDLKRARIQSFLNDATTPEETELAEALLEGSDSGEIDVLTDSTTGETLFTLKEAN